MRKSPHLKGSRSGLWLGWKKGKGRGWVSVNILILDVFVMLTGLLLMISLRLIHWIYKSNVKIANVVSDL